MSLYEWLMQYVFNFPGVEAYTDYIMLTLCILVVGFVLLVAKALAGLFYIFIK